MNKKAYLKKISETIKKGKFKENWQSLSQYKDPDWFLNGKLGIFIHFGVYSVPATVNEWYPRNMYRQDSEAYLHHVSRYGEPKEFGYKDFIPFFKAEKFSAQKWAKLFKASGAKYVMPVAEHHDGFQMYKSGLSEYNSAEMGPKRDFLEELSKEFEKEGLVFTASSHRAEHWWFFSEGLKFNSGITNKEDAGLYGPPNPAPLDMFDIYECPPNKEFLEDWLLRTCEIVDKYKPVAMYFDWWIENIAFKPYLQKFAAYYYNKGMEWGQEVAIFYKMDAFPKGCATEDFERSQLPSISPYPWQCCTSTAKNSWCYTEGNQFKTPEEIICNLIDIISKNGCMLLNIGPKADGTICREDENILRDLGKWLKVNGEAVYNTKNWRVFGEGPTEIVEGFYNDHNRKPYTGQDIRFTCKDGFLYAFVLKFPKDGVIKIKALGKHTKYFNGNIEKISALGFKQPVKWTVWEEGLTIITENINSDFPVCFKIEL